MFQFCSQTSSEKAELALTAAPPSRKVRQPTLADVSKASENSGESLTSGASLGS